MLNVRKLLLRLFHMFFSRYTKTAHVCIWNCVRRHDIHMASLVMRRCQWKKTSWWLWASNSSKTEPSTSEKKNPRSYWEGQRVRGRECVICVCVSDRNRETKREKKAKTEIQTNKCHGTPIIFSQLDYATPMIKYCLHMLLLIFFLCFLPTFWDSRTISYSPPPFQLWVYSLSLLAPE